MSQLDLNKMQEIQRQLQEKYFEKWGGLSPEKGKTKLHGSIQVYPKLKVKKEKPQKSIIKTFEVFLHEGKYQQFRNFSGPIWDGISEYSSLKAGDKVTCKITGIDYDKKRVSLSIRALIEPEATEEVAEEAAEAVEAVAEEAAE